MAKYRAIAKGYCGKQIREKGDIFDYEGKPGKWMKEVDSKGKPVEKASEEKPEVKPEGKPQGKK